MDVEVFVHGVPLGESFWGKDEDRNYFGNFYDQSSSDTVKFLIQIRPSKGKTYCYYNYLIYQNVIGNDGREGSYFGLSVRFDAYCKDFLGIYKILDIVFTAHVLNKILKVQNGNYKYAVADFASASETMSNINNTVLQLLQSTLTNESVCGLNGFSIGGGNLRTWNLYEATFSDVEAYVRKYGKAALSPYYPTARETDLAQQYESKLQSARHQYEERFNAEITAKEQAYRSLNASLASLQGEITKLQDAIHQKDSIIAQKDSAITNLNNQIRQINQDKKNYRNLESIKEPIMELASALNTSQHTAPKTTGAGVQKKGGINLKTIVPLLTLFLVLLTFLATLTGSTAKGDVSEYKKMCNKIEQLEKEKRDLQEKLSSRVDVQNENSDPFIQNVQIDVEHYDDVNNPLRTNKQYKATADNCIDTNQHHWEIKGADITSETNKKTVTFIPKSTAGVTITYSNDRGQTKTRILEVKN